MNEARSRMMMLALLSFLMAVTPMTFATAGEAPAAGQPTEDQKQLIQAAVLGDRDQLKGLLERKVDPNFLYPDASGMSPLMMAAGNGKLEIVEELLRGKADVEFADETGLTPLMNAVGSGAKVMEALIAAGADVNRRDKHGMSALMRAVAGKNAAESLPVLLKAGADPNIRQAEGATALMVAAKTGNVDAVRLLAKGGADLEATYLDQKFTALIMAVTMKKRETVDALLEAGANANHSAAGGGSPLMVAVAAGDPEVVSRLIKAGADVKQKAANGMTALDIAQNRNDGTMIELLKASSKP